MRGMRVVPPTSTTSSTSSAATRHHTTASSSSHNPISTIIPMCTIPRTDQAMDQLLLVCDQQLMGCET